MTYSSSRLSTQRVAIIGGAGKQGLQYAHALSRMPECAEITIVVDPLISQCQDSVYSSVRRCSSIEEAGSHDFDVGLIAVPHYMHYRLTSKLLGMGKHVIKEKPFASNYQEAQELYSLSKENSRKIFVTTQRSHGIMFDSIRTDLQRIGSIHNFKYEYYKNFDKPTDGWRAVRTFSCGGVVLDMGYHVFDVILRLFGFPTHVSAQCGYFYDETYSEGLEDTAEILLSYTDRKFQGSILLARHHYQKAERLEIIGERGFIVVEPRCYSVFTRDGRRVGGTGDHGQEEDLRLMLARFFASLDDRKFGEQELEINVSNMNLIDLVYQSARTHTTLHSLANIAY